MTTTDPSTETPDLRPTGLDLIAAERWRQVTQEGYHPSHDDEHDVGELVAAAQAYLMDARGRQGARGTWPWSQDTFKPSTTRMDLTKAGALIAAELDRLLRAEGIGGYPGQTGWVDRVTWAPLVAQLQEQAMRLVDRLAAVRAIALDRRKVLTTDDHPHGAVIYLEGDDWGHLQEVVSDLPGHSALADQIIRQQEQLGAMGQQVETLTEERDHLVGEVERLRALLEDAVMTTDPAHVQRLAEHAEAMRQRGRIWQQRAAQTERLAMRLWPIIRDGAELPAGTHLTLDSTLLAELVVEFTTWEERKQELGQKLDAALPAEALGLRDTIEAALRGAEAATTHGTRTNGWIEGGASYLADLVTNAIRAWEETAAPPARTVPPDVTKLGPRVWVTDEMGPGVVTTPRGGAIVVDTPMGHELGAELFRHGYEVTYVPEHELVGTALLNDDGGAYVVDAKPVDVLRETLVDGSEPDRPLPDRRTPCAWVYEDGTVTVAIAERDHLREELCATSEPLTAPQSRLIADLTFRQPIPQPNWPGANTRAWQALWAVVSGWWERTGPPLIADDFARLVDGLVHAVGSALDREPSTPLPTLPESLPTTEWYGVPCPTDQGPVAVVEWLRGNPVLDFEAASRLAALEVGTPSAGYWVGWTEATKHAAAALLSLPTEEAIAPEALTRMVDAAGASATRWAQDRYGTERQSIPVSANLAHVATEAVTQTVRKLRELIPRAGQGPGVYVAPPADVPDSYDPPSAALAPPQDPQVAAARGLHGPEATDAHGLPRAIRLMVLRDMGLSTVPGEPISTGVGLPGVWVYRDDLLAWMRAEVQRPGLGYGWTFLRHLPDKLEEATTPRNLPTTDDPKEAL